MADFRKLHLAEHPLEQSYNSNFFVRLRASPGSRFPSGYIHTVAYTELNIIRRCEAGKNMASNNLEDAGHSVTPEQDVAYQNVGKSFFTAELHLADNDRRLPTRHQRST